jgi:hypothetical protein
MKNLGLLVVAAIVGLMIPIQGAYAYTECTLSISRIFSGDGGNIWVLCSNGGAAVILSNDPDKQATLGLAMTALVTSRTVTARYTTTGASCSATNMDVEGFWLN